MEKSVQILREQVSLHFTQISNSMQFNFMNFNVFSQAILLHLQENLMLLNIIIQHKSQIKSYLTSFAMLNTETEQCC